LWMRGGVLLLLLGVLLLGRVVIDLISRGEREMAESDRSFHRGDLVTALTHARRAAALYVPGAPHVEAAYSRLVAIATGSESMGRPDMARRAWGAVRGAALETRHVRLPHRKHLEFANHRLAVLGTALRVAPGSGPVAEPSRFESLPSEHTPRWPWVAALLGGLLAAAVGLATLARYGFDSEGNIQWRRAGWSLFLLTVGAACWTLVVVRA
jgi:hypothetical protein